MVAHSIGQLCEVRAITTAVVEHLMMNRAWAYNQNNARNFHAGDCGRKLGVIVKAILKKLSRVTPLCIFESSDKRMIVIQ